MISLDSIYNDHYEKIRFEVNILLIINKIRPAFWNDASYSLNPSKFKLLHEYLHELSKKYKYISHYIFNNKKESILIYNNILVKNPEEALDKNGHFNDLKIGKILGFPCQIKLNGNKNLVHIDYYLMMINSAGAHSIYKYHIYGFMCPKNKININELLKEKEKMQKVIQKHYGKNNKVELNIS